MPVYAHSNHSPVIDSWQLLSDHADAVARMASVFALSFNSASHASLLGKCHDIGKARDSFQSYLRRCNGIEEEDQDFGEHSHSGVGACWLWGHVGNFGKALSYCVAGHHAGLPDWSGGETPGGALSIRMQEEASVLSEPAVREWISVHEADWLHEQLDRPIAFCRDDSSVSFWIRMMYSCLVDADFLDTEAFLNPRQSALRSVGQSLESLGKIFFTQLDSKQRTAANTEVNHIRAEIRAACENAAEMPLGLFSLTVPTGGGKTFSSTAFAFKHALHHGLKRIIYVIPYTSIIEQTADILRNILGELNVLEHHSNFDPVKETTQSRLAAENWDAPVIVTTAVQFFESIYACKSSRCRKLHNIAESVIILDEVQLLPTSLLLPCSEAIRQLASHYRASVVLSTATQLNLPGISHSSVREMIPSSMNLYRRLKRTEIEFPENRSIRKSWDDIAEELTGFNQVLCIVNTRKDCRELFDKMPEGTIHLSALMCGAHRSHVIANIKKRLTAQEPVRVISTQLVEAGVDIDFPVVYRAFTGLSSIAQSAGRCNREGRLASGRVVVFMPPKESPRGELRQGEYALGDLLDRPGGINPDDAQSFPDYFKTLHGRVQNLGTEFERTLGVPIPIEFRNGTIKSLPTPMQYQFREAAAAFQMIPDATFSILVRYGDNGKLLDELRIAGPHRTLMRRLQRYAISVPNGAIASLLERGFVEQVHPGVFVQTTPSLYSETTGFDLFRDVFSPEDYIIN
ncbi:MAG: CRISPR-associated endonuclease Cas3'' [Lentisphaeria bacterium]|nr:CRISPR-associated endonuclease Cas3'' [Lentisphaeria bacterium]